MTTGSKFRRLRSRATKAERKARHPTPNAGGRLRIEILLSEHWEGYLDHAMLERLASIPIEFVFQPDAARET